MIKSLQARLTLSYVLVVLVCLVLVGLTSMVLLRGYQQNLTYRRLTDRSALAATWLGELMRRDTDAQAAVRRLEQFMNRAGQPPVFVYLLNSDGTVIAGSNRRLEGVQFEQLAVTDAVGPRVVRRGERKLGPGEVLLYVAEVARFPKEPGQPGTPHILLLGELYRPLRLALGDLFPRLMWAGAVALAMSVVLAGILAYSISRPLGKIAVAAEDIASGNYEQSLTLSSTREVNRLVTSFNTMAGQIQNTMQSQRDFVANVSHDLKTPLTSIQGFAQALVDGTASDENSRVRAAAIIHEEAGRMRRLVDGLLDLARLEAGQVSLAREPVDMGQILHDCVVRLGPHLEQRDVEVDLDIRPGLAPVLGDADRLGQVLGNLVDNALVHAHQAQGRSFVTLAVEQNDSWVICSVTDNGPGIPSDDLARIFERFYQVDKSRARGKQGVGLGLAIAHEIVRAHSGHIRVESVQGLGTRFTVELPIHQGISDGGR